LAWAKKNQTPNNRKPRTPLVLSQNQNNLQLQCNKIKATLLDLLEETPPNQQNNKIRMHLGL